MARLARKKSLFRIYHVILRGINKQIIFEDNNDYAEFIETLRYYNSLCDFKLHAYCLMNNHIHLLIEEGNDSLAVVMKRIEVKFVKWYNHKYERIGYLFQDRYKSEVIDSATYFLRVFRYIHQNPLHAGLENRLGTYPWSSYADYYNNDNSFIHVETIQSFFESTDNLLQFLNTNSVESCMEYYSHTRMSDRDALKIINDLTGCKNPSDFQHLDSFQRNKCISQILNAGFSIRQTSRITGISRVQITKVANSLQSITS